MKDFNFDGIVYKGTFNKVVENEDGSDFIELYKDEEYFEDPVRFSKFVKDCEKGFRRSKEYKVFISAIKNIYGINFCQIAPGITSADATIELHHGPLFTLYDIGYIIVKRFLKTRKKITTLSVIDTMIDEHFDLCVQVVMMAVTNHEAFHNKDLFLNVRQGIGNVNGFITKYADCLEDDMKYKIYNYIELCKENPSMDSGYLDISHIEKVIRCKG